MRIPFDDGGGGIGVKREYDSHLRIWLPVTKGCTESQPIYGLRVTALALKMSNEEVAYAWAVVSMSPRLESRITGISFGIA